MRVLVVHNRYVSRNPSGENVIVAEEVESLRNVGVDVVTYLRDSDEIDGMSRSSKAATVIRPVYSPTDVRAVRRIVRTEAIDVVHVHNLTPLISPAVVRTVQGLGVPVVQTVHNHRHVCVKGTFFRDGRDCHDCSGLRFPAPAVRHGCYRESRLQSVPMAVSLAVHHGTWRHLDRYLALTPQLREHLVSAGIPAERIVVRPNTVSDPGARQEPGSGFVFVGRLDEEKGVGLLLQAWERHPEHSLGVLTIVGDGPSHAATAAASRRRADIRVTGLLDRQGVQEAIADAAVLVVPSLVPDVFPRVVLEALALARPVLATKVGGLPGIIVPECGWLVDPDPTALAGSLAVAAREAAHKRAAARRHYLDRFSPEVVLQQLLDIYAACIEERRR